ncbi:T9SS type A sorting domain-containing protein [Saccharicrinis aurantiacus]|uniref:T9SS type A sorting domain-containing protein n=1 Tax=Saccharicrinis aurantiacus TaxID=1849719 RepID=UPI000837B548|nr:T9SS type A sorting domain-containing protein [Saccharicrinis aurantiacus]
MKKIYTLIIFSLCLSGIWAQDEADFYTDYIDLAVSKNLVTDYGANGNDELDDSQALKTAISELTQLENGGRIYIPAGTYYLTKIYLDNNIHIEIDKDAIIKPTQDEWVGVDPDEYKNYTIFYFTYKNYDFKNASIRCKQADEKYTVDLRDALNTRVRVFQLNSVDNFYIADVNIYDKLTRFSSITTGTEVHNGMPDNWYSSRNGIVKDINVYGAAYGYGLVQSQALNNTLFKNLWGEGGVTLRLETGYSQMNIQQIGGNFNIVADNIYCENGNASLMVSPHETHNGIVSASNIESVNCGFAVRMSSGYTRYDTIDVGPGKYEDVYIENVKASYGSTAQVKSKHFKYMPCELRGLINEDIGPDGESYIAPAISCVVNTASDIVEGQLTYPNEIVNTESIGFEYQSKDIVTGEDVEEGCPDTYYITYNADGGSHTNPPSYNSADDDLVLLNAEKHGYIFKGWYDNANFTDDQITVIEHGSAGDFNLWAKFTIGTAVDDIDSQVTSVYPNPFNDKINIELEAQHGYNHLQLISISGKIVSQQPIAANQTKVSFILNNNSITSGIYFIKFIGNHTTFTTQVVKQ